MLMVNIGVQCIVGNDHDTHRCGSTEIDGRARGMRTKGIEEDNNIRVSLRVDDHVSRAAKVQRGREAPSLVGRQFGEDNIDESSNTEDDAPFVIARKLLRRRHIRKDQARKEREAREALNNVRDKRIHRKRKTEHSDGEPIRKLVTTAGILPHPSPMLTKSESFFEECETKDQRHVDMASTMISHSTSLITFSPLRSSTYSYRY